MHAGAEPIPHGRPFRAACCAHGSFYSDDLFCVVRFSLIDIAIMMMTLVFWMIDFLFCWRPEEASRFRLNSPVGLFSDDLFPLLVHIFDVFVALVSS